MDPVRRVETESELRQSLRLLSDTSFDSGESARCLRVEAADNLRKDIESYRRMVTRIHCFTQVVSVFVVTLILIAVLTKVWKLW